MATKAKNILNSIDRSIDEGKRTLAFSGRGARAASPPFWGVRITARLARTLLCLDRVL